MTELSRDQAMLLAAIEAHNYDEWYSALLHAALEETGNATAAVRAANEAFKKNAVDPSAPMPDDADALFAKPGSAAMSQEDNTLADQVKDLKAQIEEMKKAPNPVMEDLLAKLAELLALQKQPPATGKVVKTNEIIYDRNTGKPKKVITTEETK